ncbi:MAG: hypothetical protein FWH59_03640 [Lentimicrobiaceae bacterium]|nr:hypothetical protein [Lentimicrobiaceae bacterium]
MRASGNHGRNNTDPSPPGGISALTPSTTPQQSTRSFVAPSAMPIKKTPDITDIIGEQKKEELNTPLTSQPSTLNSQPSTLNSEDFSSHWRAMFEQVFAAIPIIYHPLKESLPEIENNIIKVIVKNKIQKEHFEAKTREVLEYLRINFDEKIEDVIVETDEKMETKKIIYDVKDKLQNFKEQNEEFEDFMQILDMKIKD